MTPASAPSVLTNFAIAGVGITPTRITSHPVDKIPAIRAYSSKSPDIRVSFPTSIFAFSLPFVITCAPYLPSAIASSIVNSSLATPRTPSVPNNLDIISP